MMIDSLKLYLGPAIGFCFTTGTVLFIALTAHRTAKPGALEALQAQARGEHPDNIPQSGS